MLRIKPTAVIREIFPAPSAIVFVIVIVIVIVFCCSCGSSKAVQTVRDVRTDTIYLNSQQYDSIYIYREHVTDHHIGTRKHGTLELGTLEHGSLEPDTLYIKDMSIEYRYKLLRDTIYKTQVDSIPYQVTVTEVKEITRPLTWYDHLTRSVFWVVIGILAIYLIRIILKFRKL